MTDMTKQDRQTVNTLIAELVADALGSDVVLCLSVNSTAIDLEGSRHVLAAVSTKFHDLTGDIPAHVMPVLFRELADALEERDRDGHD